MTASIEQNIIQSSNLENDLISRLQKLLPKVIPDDKIDIKIEGDFIKISDIGHNNDLTLLIVWEKQDPSHHGDNFIIHVEQSCFQQFIGEEQADLFNHAETLLISSKICIYHSKDNSFSISLLLPGSNWINIHPETVKRKLHTSIIAMIDHIKFKTVNRLFTQ